VTPDTLAPHINPKTRAIMPVHFAGRPCMMPAIMDLAARHGLTVIEDSAECLGASVGGRQAGGFDTGIFSFYATKNITTGEGGMVTTHDADLAEWLRVRLAHGVKKGSYTRDGVSRGWYRNAVAPGHNFRLSNFQAAMGIVQLAKLEAMNQRRHAVAALYDAGLSGVDGVERPELLPPGQHSYQMYAIKVPAAKRDRVLLALQAAGIGASAHFDPPVHWQSAYSSPAVSLPVTERLARSVITLPISSVQTTEQTGYVIDALRREMAR
jgi:perosamine synthetase